MRKDIGLLIVVIVSLLLIWKLGFFPFLSTSFYTQDNQFESFTSAPRDSSCDIESFFIRNNLIASPTSIIKTPYSTFKFVTTTSNTIEKYSCKTIPSGQNVVQIGIDDDGCPHWSYEYSTSQSYSRSINTCEKYFKSSICPSITTKSNGIVSQSGDCSGCGGAYYDISCPMAPSYLCDSCTCNTQRYVEDYGGLFLESSTEGCNYNVKVYKDDVLIDEVRGEGTKKRKVYTDDGDVLDLLSMPSGKSGIEVSFGERLYYHRICLSECQVKHQYRIYVPEDKITIDLSTPKQEYLEGEDINISVLINNNFDISLIGKLKIKYEVPTILGTKEDTREYDLNILTGENKYSYTIPTDIRTESLTVTPSVNLYLKTEGFSGVNVLNGFEEFGIERGAYNAVDRLRILSIEGDENLIRIKSMEEELREQLNLTKEQLALLNASLQEKISLIEQYKGNLEEQTYIINSYNLTLDEQAELIAKLNLSSEEEEKLVGLLYAEIDKQNELLNKIDEEKKDSEKRNPYWIYILLGLLVFFFILFLGRRWMKKLKD